MVFPRITQDGLPSHNHEDGGRGGASVFPDHLSVAIETVLRGRTQIDLGSELQIKPLLVAATANQNNYNPLGAPGIVFCASYLTGNGSFNITGVDSSWCVDGDIIVWTKIGTGTTTFKNASASSTAANRFSIGADIAIVAGQSVAFVYSLTAARWLIYFLGLPSSSALADHQHTATGDGGDSLQGRLVRIGTTWSAANTVRALDIDALNGSVYLEPFVDSPIAANKNDYNPHGVAGTPFCYTHLGTTASRNVTGADSTWTSAVAGSIIGFTNLSSSTGTFVFKENSASSAAGNRFDNGGYDVYLAPGQSVFYAYDSLDQIWVCISQPTATPGTWTPALAFATVGTSSWAFSQQLGWYSVVGNRLFYEFTVTGVPTNGTAAGNLQVTGLPFAAVNTVGELGAGPASVTGYTKAGYTSVITRINSAGGQRFNLQAMGSGVAIAALAVADIPTGGTVTVTSAGHYALS
jgi:hypothetical protein